MCSDRNYATLSFMEQKFIANIQEKKLIQAGDGILAAVSGGADSVCLLLLLHRLQRQLPITIAAAHVNHGIRGDSALADQQFVEKLCTALGIPCYVKVCDVPALAKQWGMSEEEAGRQVRYDYFDAVSKKYGFDKIAVAHNQDDNVETIIHHLLRGTGLNGITGISPDRNQIIRPLLPFSKQEIVAYLNKAGQPYCTDETNQELCYTRNKIRLSLIPKLREINQQAETHILQFGRQAEEIEAYLQIQTEAAGRQYIKKEQDYNSGILLAEAARQEHPVIQKRLVRELIRQQSGRLKDITAVHVENVLGLWRKQTGRRICLPYGLTARRSYEGIVIEKQQQPKEKEQTELVPALSEHNPVVYEVGGGILTLEIKREKIQNIAEKIYTKWLDYDRIKESLVIRTPRQGDYLVVTKEGGTKKLRRYLIDEKVPANERERQLVLADGNHILWVIGYRISEYYKITKETRCILKVQWEER